MLSLVCLTTKRFTPGGYNLLRTPINSDLVRGKLETTLAIEYSHVYPLLLTLPLFRRKRTTFGQASCIERVQSLGGLLPKTVIPISWFNGNPDLLGIANLRSKQFLYFI